MHDVSISHKPLYVAQMSVMLMLMKLDEFRITGIFKHYIQHFCMKLL